MIDTEVYAMVSVEIQKKEGLHRIFDNILPFHQVSQIAAKIRRPTDGKQAQHFQSKTTENERR